MRKYRHGTENIAVESTNTVLDGGKAVVPIKTAHDRQTVTEA